MRVDARRGKRADAEEDCAPAQSLRGAPHTVENAEGSCARECRGAGANVEHDGHRKRPSVEQIKSKARWEARHEEQRPCTGRGYQEHCRVKPGGEPECHQIRRGEREPVCYPRADKVRDAEHRRASKQGERRWMAPRDVQSIFSLSPFPVSPYYPCQGASPPI